MAYTLATSPFKPVFVGRSVLRIYQNLEPGLARYADDLILDWQNFTGRSPLQKGGLPLTFHEPSSNLPSSSLPRGVYSKFEFGLPNRSLKQATFPSNVFQESVCSYNKSRWLHTLRLVTLGPSQSVSQMENRIRNNHLDRPILPVLSCRSSRIARWALQFYLLSMLLAVALAIGLLYTIRPGRGQPLAKMARSEECKTANLSEVQSSR
jgi:hypothetical protein